MQYHLDTIPVWEAMELHSECPLCALERKTEREEVERTLGTSVMEPDVRIRFNERGACRRHQQMLFAQQNRLGHALMMDSHVIEKLESFRKLSRQAVAAAGARNGFFAKSTSVQPILDQLQTMETRCVVCDSIDTHMARYRYTFLHLWKTNDDFKNAWKASHGVCLPHLTALLQDARTQLSAAQQNTFAAEALEKLTERLTNDEKDLDWFIRKYDYRNQALPWGESKTATERAVNRLRGWCVGNEPDKPSAPPDQPE